MYILDLEFFVEVQYDIFEILSPNNIYRSLPSKCSFKKSRYIFKFTLLHSKLPK